MDIKQSFKTGLSFGITSGVITTLGLLIGLVRATGSRSIAISGVVAIALADSLSDSLGIHISEESKTDNQKEIWEATITTFVFKLLTAVSFLVPLFVFSIDLAILVSSLWGISLLSFLSYKISIGENRNYKKVVVEHVIIALVVILVTYFVGGWTSTLIY